MVLDNPVSFEFILVLVVIGGTASNLSDFEGTELKLLEFHGHQTRVTASVQIIDDTLVERAEQFSVWALRNGLDDDILTPTCGETSPTYHNRDHR